VARNRVRDCPARGQLPIKDSRLLWLKFVLFVFAGLMAVGGALLLYPGLRLALLLAIAIWSFCRAYYFAFYVIERYIDPSFRFAGLTSLVRYAVRHRVFTKKAA
jgi:hypothetical protein